MKAIVIPSLPAQSFLELENLVLTLGSLIKEIQVDIVDGNFVSAKSWPFTEENPLQEFSKLKDLPSSVAIEMDCMVNEPEKYFTTFFDLGVKKVILHYGSTAQLSEAINELKANNIEVGLAFTNDIPLHNIEPFISLVDYVQVMGIAVVGAQGQPFDERTLHTTRVLRETYPELTIAVDGSVNQETIVALKEAGVNRFLPGSAVAKASDPKVALENLRQLVLA
jgi:ribulose-phosphate 3-epimerase